MSARTGAAPVAPPPGDLGYREHYFDGEIRTPRIALGETPSVRRHFEATIAPLELTPDARVLELGCGLGRFTQLLLARGHRVTALDLSAYLLGQLRERLGGSDRLQVVEGRAEDVARLAAGPYDAVVGFFFLHHLPHLAPVFAAASSVLVDGGQIAFVEPNAFNPLVYLQVTFTPGMTWKGEPSIPRMRPGVVFPLLAGTGFDGIGSGVYGMLPPLVANTGAGQRIERALEAFPPFRPFSAYRWFRARKPGAIG